MSLSSLIAIIPSKGCVVLAVRREGALPGLLQPHCARAAMHGTTTCGWPLRQPGHGAGGLQHGGPAGPLTGREHRCEHRGRSAG